MKNKCVKNNKFRDQVINKTFNFFTNVKSFTEIKVRNKLQQLANLINKCFYQINILI